MRDEGLGGGGQVKEGAEVRFGGRHGSRLLWDEEIELNGLVWSEEGSRWEKEFLISPRRGSAFYGFTSSVDRHS